MIIHNILMQYGTTVLALMILENILMFILIIFSLFHFFRTRKVINEYGDVIEDYESVVDSMQKYYKDIYGDCKK